jgi:hypothetical protein
MGGEASRIAGVGRMFALFEPSASIVGRSPPPLSRRHDDFDRL